MNHYELQLDFFRSFWDSQTQNAETPNVFFQGSESGEGRFPPAISRMLILKCMNILDAPIQMLYLWYNKVDDKIWLQIMIPHGSLIKI